MIQTSLAKRIALIAAGGLMSCLFAAVASSAAEIKVLTSVALTSAFNELAPNFEQATGNKLNIGYSLIADIRKRMLDGETADVIILSRPVMDELDKQQKFASGSVTNVAATPVALAIRAGAPKPDISTVDALKRTLLAAKSIVYADPAKGGASGSGSAWPASRGIRQHDSLDRWDWHNHQSARGGEIVYPIPQWTGCQTGVQCQRLSTRIAIPAIPKD